MALTMMIKDTWWNRLRVNRNITYDELAKHFAYSTSTLGAYFTGEIMPADDTIKKLCEFFDVEFGEGKHEFFKAHKEWESSHHQGKSKLTTGKSKCPARILITGSRTEGVKTTVKVEDLENINIFELIYGKIPYELFIQFFEEVAGKTGDPLKLIYGKVSFADFNLISNILME